MRSNPPNPSIGEMKILYYPDKIVYLRDFNAVTLEINPPMGEAVSLSVTFTVYYLNEQRSFSVNTNGNTATADLSYFLRELGEGVTIDRITAEGQYLNSYSNQWQNISIIETLSFVTSNGYSLPNRQHYTETSVYTPPLSIYRQDGHPNATNVELEFATKQTTVINGERHNAGESFQIQAPEDDCKIDVEVDVVGGYNAWNTSNAGWTYGCSHFWANHILVDKKSPVGSFILSNLPEIDPSIVIFTNNEDLDGWLGTEYYTIGALFVPVANKPNVYQILAFSAMNTAQSEPIWINASGENFFIHTDDFDDFLIIDYNDVRGYKRPTYGIFDSNNNKLQDCDFIIRNTRTETAKQFDAAGTLFVALNHPIRSLTRPSGQSLHGYIMEILGLTAFAKDYDTNYYPYDYTVVDFNTNNDTQPKYALRTLMLGVSSGLNSPAGTGLRKANNNGFWYCTLHGQTNTPTLYPLATQNVSGFSDIPQYTIVYLLWYFLNFDHNWVYPLNSSTVQGGSITFTSPASTKLFDNAINVNSSTGGVSVIRAQHVGVKIPMTYGQLDLSTDKTLDGKSIAEDMRDLDIKLSPYIVYLYPIPANQSKYLSSAVALSTEIRFEDDPSTYRIWFDLSGQVTTIEPERPDTIYFYFADESQEMLNFTETKTFYYCGSSAFDTTFEVSFVCQDDFANNIQYYLFPYNCAIPTILTNDDILPKYALMPSMIGSIGRIEIEGQSILNSLFVVGCYVSPFNVGHSTTFGDVTYPNNPEDTSWFSLFGYIDYTKPIRNVLSAPTEVYSTYKDYFYDLYNGIEMLYSFNHTWKNTGRPLLTYEGDLSTSVPVPCEKSENAVLDFTKGVVTSYRIILYSLCDTDQVFWLKYENMDGFVRWLPFEIKRRVYENTMGDFKFVTPTSSSINAYPMQSPLTLQEKITCFIGDVPQDCYIEDILYSPYLEGWNWDGSVHFQCVLEENEIVRDSSQELEDFVFNFIKKK